MFQFFEEFVVKMKLLLLLLLIIVPANRLLVQEIPDCMCPPLKHPPSGYLVNQDSSIVIDTCGIWYPFSNCDFVYWGNVFSLHGKEAQDRIYAKNTWLIWFDVKAIPLPEAPSDSVIEVTWEDIDSLNYPEIRDSLKSIEQIYGPFKLIKVDPQFTEPPYGQDFHIYFDNYVNVNFLIKKFRDCPFTHCDFLSWLADDYPSYVSENNNGIELPPQILVLGNYLSITNQSINKHNIKIYAINGFEIKENDYSLIDNKIFINLKNISNGFYFILIDNEVYKFIKEN
jgi:hypothetical protein